MIFTQLRNCFKLTFPFVLFVVFIQSSNAQDNKTELWQALKSGKAFAIMRHALAPGTGDPANFTLGKCETQRNLSEEGREQARKIGEHFRQNGIETAAVYSSQWCRCMDTARLLNLGKAKEQPSLNSFFRNFERREPQTQALTTWVTTTRFEKPLILVTHQVNISALTGRFTRSGEIIVVARKPDGTLEPLGSL